MPEISANIHVKRLDRFYISDQISNLIRDVEKMIEQQKDMKEDFKQSITGLYRSLIHIQKPNLSSKSFNQISNLIRDAEKMIEQQKEMKEDFKQSITGLYRSLIHIQKPNLSSKSFNSFQHESQMSNNARQHSKPNDNCFTKSYWHRLFGEIAHRLDQKIVNYVTVGVCNKMDVSDIIGFCSHLGNVHPNHKNHKIFSVYSCGSMHQRLTYVLAFLEDYKYSLEVHPMFAHCMQRKYGRLDNKYYCYMANWMVRDEPYSVVELLSCLAVDEFERKHIHILYSCLLALNEKDENIFDEILT